MSENGFSIVLPPGGTWIGDAYYVLPPGEQTCEPLRDIDLAEYTQLGATTPAGEEGQ